MFSAENKTDCILWYQDSKSPKKVQVKFREKCGRNAKAPTGSAIKIWYERFKKTGFCMSFTETETKSRS